MSDREKLREEILKAAQKVDYSYRPDFIYKTRNPYSEKISVYDSFVCRDDIAEGHRGKWNQEVFKRELPLHVEIGTGFGHFMHEYCSKNPELNFVGLDYRFKRSFELAQKLEKIKIKNFRYLRAKGERLGFLFDKQEIDTLFYFFPDPWPKAKHRKKRLFQERFLKIAHSVLKPEGTFYIKTDHDGYYEWMDEVIKIYHENKDNPPFEIKLNTTDLKGEHPEHFLSSFETKFEKIFLKKGIRIKALELVKKT